MEKFAPKKDMKELFEAVAKLKTADECKKFFRDICTLSELNSIAERYQVAKLLQKKLSYREISKQTKASTTTVTRVAYWFFHGLGGYKLILNRKK